MPRTKHVVLAATIGVVLAAVLAGLVGRDILLDRQIRIRITSDTPLLAERPDSLANEAKIRVVATLVPGDQVHVLRVRHAKDIMAIRVDSKRGPGWIVYSSRSILFEGDRRQPAPNLSLERTLPAGLPGSTLSTAAGKAAQLGR